jgi:hypothetical protein
MNILPLKEVPCIRVYEPEIIPVKTKIKRFFVNNREDFKITAESLILVAFMIIIGFAVLLLK